MNTVKLRELVAKASPAPWVRCWIDEDDSDAGLEIRSGGLRVVEANAEDLADCDLIVAMRNTLPELLNAFDETVVALQAQNLQALQQRVFRLEEIHNPSAPPIPSELALEEVEEFCGRCLGVGRVSYGGPLILPCPRCLGSGRRRKK